MWDAGDLHLVVDICLHLQHSLQRRVGMLDLDQNVRFFSLPGLCAGVTGVTPLPFHSQCLAAGCQISVLLQFLGVSQVTLDLVFLIFSAHVLTLKCQSTPISKLSCTMFILWGFVYLGGVF